MSLSKYFTKPTGSRSGSPRDFPQFPRLAQEMQGATWEFAIQASLSLQRIHFDEPPLEDYKRSRVPIIGAGVSLPAVGRACHRARQLALEKYIFLIVCPRIDPKIIHQPLCRETCQSIRQVAISTKGGAMLPILQDAALFPQLRRVLLITETHRVDYRQLLPLWRILPSTRVPTLFHLQEFRVSASFSRLPIEPIDFSMPRAKKFPGKCGPDEVGPRAVNLMRHEWTARLSTPPPTPSRAGLIIPEPELSQQRAVPEFTPCVAILPLVPKVQYARIFLILLIMTVVLTSPFIQFWLLTVNWDVRTKVHSLVMTQMISSLILCLLVFVLIEI
ncbi:Uu.00g064500.m01.CDS01 [Anthostomella pinea]|uniref:Uu.00g064500.m01.CDS01 n=1 Tax=Anthostomella pinea TaxID=933095 RepID=A0AAI8VU70_9PEZI|nr:Uu.00g064500.m01.CDS01 [Anthostomella pinea]